MIILSTWKYKAVLVSVGIDAEKIDRFLPFVHGERESPELIFSRDELKFCLESLNPAASMCASFTYKEALFKSIGPYNYSNCYLKADFYKQEQTTFNVPDSLLKENGLSFVSVFTCKNNTNEIVTVVHTWRK